MFADAGVGLEGWVVGCTVQVGCEEVVGGGLGDCLCAVHDCWWEG